MRGKLLYLLIILFIPYSLSYNNVDYLVINPYSCLPVGVKYQVILNYTPGSYVVKLNPYSEYTIQYYEVDSNHISVPFIYGGEDENKVYLISQESSPSSGETINVDGKNVIVLQNFTPRIIIINYTDGISNVTVSNGTIYLKLSSTSQLTLKLSKPHRCADVVYVFSGGTVTGGHIISQTSTFFSYNEEPEVNLSVSCPRYPCETTISVIGKDVTGVFVKYNKVYSGTTLRLPSAGLVRINVEENYTTFRSNTISISVNSTNGTRKLIWVRSNDISIKSQEFRFVEKTHIDTNVTIVGNNIIIKHEYAGEGSPLYVYDYIPKSWNVQNAIVVGVDDDYKIIKVRPGVYFKITPTTEGNYTLRLGEYYIAAGAQVLKFEPKKYNILVFPRKIGEVKIKNMWLAEENEWNIKIKSDMLKYNPKIIIVYPNNTNRTLVLSSESIKLKDVLKYPGRYVVYLDLPYIGKVKIFDEVIDRVKAYYVNKVSNVTYTVDIPSVIPSNKVGRIKVYVEAPNKRGFMVVGAEVRSIKNRSFIVNATKTTIDGKTYVYFEDDPNNPYLITFKVVPVEVRTPSVPWWIVPIAIAVVTAIP